MKLNKIATAVVAATLMTVGATSVSAATWTLDYRHRYEDLSEHHYDRICVIGAFDNGIGFYADSSFKSGSSSSGNSNDPDQWGDLTTNATELSVYWTYKFEGTGFSIQPGLITESTSETTGWKPYVRLQYNTDFGLWFATRLRYDYWRYDEDVVYSGSTNSDEDPIAVKGYKNKSDQKNGRVDLYVGYKYGAWDFSYNFTYMKALNDDDANGKDRVMHDNDDWNYEHEFTVGYKYGNWRPYLQVANLHYGDATGDLRQTRFAVGVAYTF